MSGKLRITHAREVCGRERSGYVAFTLYSPWGALVGVDVIVSMEGDEDVPIPYRHKVRGRELKDWVLTRSRI